MSATRWRKAGAVLSGAVTILLIAMALLLAFFLLQSRLTGTEPSIVGHKIYIVMSGSMEPAVKMGGVVVVQPLPAEEVQPGDIITFRGENSRSLTTHRVVSTETENGLLFYTKGDANESLDPLPVKAQQLVGKVVLTVPYLGYPFAFIRTRAGLVTLFSLVVLIVAGRLIRSYLVEKQQLKETDSEEVVAGSATDDPQR